MEFAKKQGAFLHQNDNFALHPEVISLLMQPITKDDIQLINALSARKYTGNSMASMATEKEKEKFKLIKQKLKDISEYFSKRYESLYGPFEADVSSGNPITYAGTLNNLWGTFYKGAGNKQFAAQITFVMNRRIPCLDVGFYFGRASRHGLSREERLEAENKMNVLGTGLSNSIMSNPAFKEKYDSLFDYGFRAYSEGTPVLPEEWTSIIRTQTGNSQISARLYPNDFGVIEISSIDLHISQVIFMMAAIGGTPSITSTVIIKPLTPEQRAKQAERLAQIGQNGELYVMDLERQKLASAGQEKENYPRHVALESSHYGYDILSLDENGGEIFIEVKTTTRTRDDNYSRRFFISLNEYGVFKEDVKKYRLYRVYDIDNNPTHEILDLQVLEPRPEGYIVEY
jgi:hypothetical protein